MVHGWAKYGLQHGEVAPITPGPWAVGRGRAPRGRTMMMMVMGDGNDDDDDGMRREWSGWIEIWTAARRSGPNHLAAERAAGPGELQQRVHLRVGAGEAE